MISFSKLMSVEGVSPIRNEIFLGSDGNTDCGATASSFSSGATTTSSSFNLRPTLPRMSFFASLPIHATSSSPPSVPEDTSVQLESAEACEEADTNPQQPPLSHLPSPPPTRDVAAASVLSNISATALSEAATAALDRESPRGDSASIPFHIPETTASSLNGGHASIKSFSPASAITSTVSDDAKLMVYMGVDCVIEIFSVQSSRTRDFCRLFVKLGLLRHISLAFDCVYTLVRQTTICCSPSCLAGQRKRRGTNSKCNSVTSVKGHERKGSDFSDHSVISKPEISSCNQECRYLSNIASIFLKISRSDAPVALQMASDTQVITSIMAVLKDPRLLTPVWNNQGTVSTCSTESRNSYLTNISGKSHACMSILGLSPCTVGIIETLLKCLKNLSMESSALADLEKAGIIPTLVSLLGGPVSIRCKNHIVPCIFNMCRINKRRQEDAVMHGLIPHLQSLILNDSQMKQFALPILCSLAYTSATTRAELLKCGGAAFYINLLKENYWQTFALNSLAVW